MLCLKQSCTLHVGSIVLLLGMLGGCASTGRPAPVVTPGSVVAPTSAPGSAPGVVAADARLPGVRVLAPENYPTQLARQRQQLADSGRDVLARDDVGYYLDVQQARLQQFGSDQVRVTRESNQIRLTLAGATSFEVSSARLTADSAALVGRIADVLRDYRQSLLSVHGHTDDSGNPAANLRLSQQRALTVARLLVQHGVEPDRVVVVGHGPTMPVADNLSTGGRERNRRVELVLDPVVRPD